MCNFDEERWREEYENSEAKYDISFEEYEHNREVEEYGQTDEDLGIDELD